MTSCTSSLRKGELAIMGVSRGRKQGYHTSFFRKDSPSFLLSVLFKICCPFCPFFSLFVLIVLLVLINSFLSFYVLLVDYILEWLS